MGKGVTTFKLLKKSGGVYHKIKRNIRINGEKKTLEDLTEGTIKNLSFNGREKISINNKYEEAIEALKSDPDYGRVYVIEDLAKERRDEVELETKAARASSYVYEVIKDSNTLPTMLLAVLTEYTGSLDVTDDDTLVEIQAHLYNKAKRSPEEVTKLFTPAGYFYKDNYLKGMLLIALNKGLFKTEGAYFKFMGNQVGFQDKFDTEVVGYFEKNPGMLKRLVDEAGLSKSDTEFFEKKYDGLKEAKK